MKELLIQNNTYQLTDEAHVSLQQYLESIQAHFADEQEVVTDIEMACSELLSEMLLDRTDTVVTIADVHLLMQKLGTVEMIIDQPAVEAVMVHGKKLYRDSERKWMGGVASGLAAYFGLPVWVLRLAFIIALVSPLPSIIPYFILWFVMPVTKTKTDQLRMHGVPVSLSSLSNDDGYTKRRVVTLATIAAILVGLFVLLCVVVITAYVLVNVAVL